MMLSTSCAAYIININYSILRLERLLVISHGISVDVPVIMLFVICNSRFFCERQEMFLMSLLCFRFIVFYRHRYQANYREKDCGERHNQK